jgi:ribosomal-protein-alanine acetyltransferase
MLIKPGKNPEMKTDYYLTRLTTRDVNHLQPLEEKTNLAFWGTENYHRFLEEFPEYFGYKAASIEETGREEMLGFFLARSLYENLEILKVGVTPEYQRQGIGTHLMQTACTEGIRRGCRKCFLEVRKSNQPAIQFYIDHGFRISGIRRGYYSAPLEDALIMEKEL